MPTTTCSLQIWYHRIRYLVAEHQMWKTHLLRLLCFWKEGLNLQSETRIPPESWIRMCGSWILKLDPWRCSSERAVCKLQDVALQLWYEYDVAESIKLCSLTSTHLFGLRWFCSLFSKFQPSGSNNNAATSPQQKRKTWRASTSTWKYCVPVFGSGIL